MKWERVSIFISSTFNDMHAERDYLVKDVFPELREWCEERKIHLIDIDLRWGVTEEDSSSNHTVLACLNNIDDSRPFFLCFLGQRRGWVPQKSDISPASLAEYPDISKTIGRHSVTEMEIEHALLSPMRHIVNGNEKNERPVEHALFYFRSPDYLDNLTNEQRKIFTNEVEKDISLADNELLTFKNEIKTRWQSTIDYECYWDKNIISPELPENVNQGRLTGFSVGEGDLKDIIIAQLKEEILKEFPGREKVEYTSYLERDLDQQSLFMELNSEGFISREGDFDDLNEYIANNKDGLFVLTARAGSGKSMLLANFIKRESKKHSARFFNRFCGVSDLSSEQYSLWKTVFDEAHIECPDTLIELKNQIEDLLEELAEEETVLVIDAINQLSDGLDMLDWLPKQLPENLKIILSLKEDEEDKELTGIIERLREDESISYSTVKPFNDREEKRKLIKEYLKKYLKALDDQQIDTICDFESSNNPLYLKILLSELRIFGSFDQLSKVIQQFGETPEEAFNTVLIRLENEINLLGVDSREFTSLLFGLLSCARNGLSEEEWVACILNEIQIDREKLRQGIRLFIRQVRPFMARREGRTDYFYESFKLAAKERYINNKIHYNELLANYFKGQADPESILSFKGGNIRDFNELTYHLKESKNRSYLEKILSTYLWIRNKSELSDIFNTINDYNYIEIEDKYDLKQIKESLLISSHILKNHIENLPTQLWGRLKDVENTKIKCFLTEVEDCTNFIWLKPLHFMNSPEGALKMTLTGHIMSVKCISISPDGKYIVSGSIDNSIRIWDWRKQKVIARLEGHTDIVNSICFSPDGQYLVSGSDDGFICVWNWKNQLVIARLDGHKHAVNSVCFSPDGQYVVSGEISVRIWDWKKQKEIARLDIPQGVSCVCFSPDGQYIIVSASTLDNSIRIWDWKEQGSLPGLDGQWDWKKQENLPRLDGHKGLVESVCFSPDGQYIVSCSSWYEPIRVWDWKKQKEIARLGGNEDASTNVCFSPDGLHIVAGFNDRSIRVWDWKKWKEIARLEGHVESVECVCFSPDGEYIVSGSYDASVRIWDWKKQKKTDRLNVHTDHIVCLCISPDGQYIASESKDKSVRVWDWEKQKEIAKLDSCTYDASCICFTVDGKYIASGSHDTIHVWDWKKQEEVAKLNGHESFIKSVRFSDDSQYIVSGSSDKTIRVWDWKKQKEIVRLDENARSVCFSPDGQCIIASTQKDDSVRVWDWKKQKEIIRFDARTNQEWSSCPDWHNIVPKPYEGSGIFGKFTSPENLARYDGFREIVNFICFSPDGKYLASASYDKNISVWDWKKQKGITIFNSHTYGVKNLYFSADGKYIISISNEDNSIRVWDWKNLHNNQEPITIPFVAEEEILSCIFSIDNNQIVAGGTSGQLLFYSVENLIL